VEMKLSEFTHTSNVNLFQLASANATNNIVSATMLLEDNRSLSTYSPVEKPKNFYDIASRSLKVGVGMDTHGELLATGRASMALSRLYTQNTIRHSLYTSNPTKLILVTDWDAKRGLSLLRGRNTLV